MTDCFFCKKKIGWTTNYSDIKTMISAGEYIPGGMTDKDKVCETCIREGKTSEHYRDPSEPTLPSETATIPSETITETHTKNLSNFTSADQLRTLTQTLHNQFKAQWDKNAIVQFKNNEIAILKRVWGQQVQFIIAYSQVTKEGYRLMAIDEGMEAQGSGFSGGASAYFYFQKMDYVR